MTALPTLPTYASNTPLTSTQLAQLNTFVAFLQDPPKAMLRQTADQTIPNATWTAISLDHEDVDSDPSGTGGHTGGSPTRFTAVYPGRYFVSGAVSFHFNATGSRGARFAVNGTAVDGAGALDEAVSASFGNTVAPPAMLLYLNVGDYLQLQAFQDSGGNLDTSGGTATAQPFMAVRWIGAS